MSQQVINTGSTANDNTGDTLRTSWQKANANFDEIYAALQAKFPSLPDQSAHKKREQRSNRSRFQGY